jgi:hypothetical protein
MNCINLSLPSQRSIDPFWGLLRSPCSKFSSLWVMECLTFFGIWAIKKCNFNSIFLSRKTLGMGGRPSLSN